MSKKIKLEVKEEQEDLEEQIRSQRIETYNMKPEVKNEQVVKIEIPESPELGNSVLYCIGGIIGYCDEETGRWDRFPIRSISYLSYSLTTPHWTTIDWPHPRLHPGTVIHDHKLYIFGGNGPYYHSPEDIHLSTYTVFSRPTYFDTIEVFDLRAKSWLPVRRLPFGMTRMHVCSLGDYIYIFGGIRRYKEGIRFTGPPLRYCPVSDRFEEMPDCSKMGVCRKLLELDDYLYAIYGGSTFSGYLSMQRYDPTADQWSLVVRTDPDGVREHQMSATVHCGKIYALSHNGLDVFCPETGSWNRLADAPDHDEDKMIPGELTSINNRLLSVGNLCFLPHFKVFEFDLDAAVWIRMTDGDVVRNKCSVQVYNPLQ